VTAPAMTLTETILARASGQPFVAPGDEIWARADRMIMNDSSGPRRIAALVDELGGILDRDRVVVVSDHFAPAASARHAEILKTTRLWAREKEVPAFFEYQGILHNLVLEKWLVRPGMLLVGADSHTVSAGAAAAVAVAVGSTELATVLATGEVWLRVPETMRIDLEGSLGPMVDLRDVTMHLLGELSIQYASYRAIEYGGSFVDELDVEQRMVLSNQGIEMGAKNAIVVPTAKLAQAMRAAGVAPHALAAPDPAARYAERRTFQVGALAPLVAAHPSPDHVRPAAAVDQAIDMAWIGSCVGGRGADLRAAAQVLAGRKVRVPTLATPATSDVYRAALADGTLATLADAGVVINPPGCGACAGVHMGVQGPGDVVIATATRNFTGRMGSPDARVYIGSAYTVAASAVAGRVIDPREIGTRRGAGRGADAGMQP
jgi:3-isopropylmalate/(R)-2-methylmalate dehydratase large subunit